MTGIRRTPLIFGLVLSSLPAFAHPMGNFSVNHYAKISIGRESIEVRYVIDMAEIPAFQEMRQFDIGTTAGDSSASRYLAMEEQILKKGISLERDGKSIPLDTISRHLALADGAGGLPTMKIAFVFRGKDGATAGTHRLSWTDNNFPGRAGWKEIVVPGATDRSQELTNYSTDMLNSPPQQLSAVVSYKTFGISPAPQVSAILKQPAAHMQPVLPGPITSSPVLSPGRPQNTPRSRFTELIATQDKPGFWLLFSAALIAAGLGALHALEPGHGKTVVAAYLVGSRGTARHAVLLGIVVTLSHMAGVYLLGGATLYASRYIVPEQLYPWLGAISGLSVAGIGIFIFLRHRTGETGEHSHSPAERHSHWFTSTFRQAAPTEAVPTERALSLRELCMLGITGGIVPCPAALVVLLSAFSLHRLAFGLFLITAFSLGLAAVLVVVGLAMVYAKRAMSSRVPAGNTVLPYLPYLSSAFMVVLGVAMATSAIAPLRLWHGLPSNDKLVPFVGVVLLGLFLGMRHSTDPDHVVAVSTIVSRQGSIRSSAAIGLLWGLGHTLTIFFVGSAIIVFGVVIPPRVGLSMEFCVAFMLVLLGVLNLTGAAGRVTGCTESKKEPVANQRSRRRMGFLAEETIGRLGLYQTVRPLAVGLVHGLAGSAAVALLVLSTIKSPLWSTAYLLVFGFGTMVGMMLMTTAISMPLVYTGKKIFGVNRYLVTISGFASTAFGLFLVYQIGFVDGLFTSHVHWIPR